jgi:hypothetical protein
MTSMSSGPRPSRTPATSDIYTALLMVAFLFLLAATIYVGYQAVTMLGGILPPPGA